MVNDQSETELIAQAKDGSQKAFEELVRRYQDYVVNFLFRMTHDKEIALEQAQEAFIKAFHSLKSFKGDSTFKTWVTTIAVNSAKTFLMKKNKFESFKNNSELPSHEQLNPEESFKKNQTIKNVRAALMNLKSEYQEVIRLCAIEGFSYSEAASVLKLPLGTVCSRMNSALSELRTILSKEVSDE